MALQQQKPTLGVALGGGSIRGFAHIGVLEVLEEHNIRPDYIAGTSIGSAIGAMYACGQSAHRLAQVLPYLNLKTVVPVRPRRQGFVDGKDYREMVELLTYRRNIENTDIPYRAVAVDLISGEKIVLDQGPIGKAVQASSAVPGVFMPVPWGEWLLADGFLLDNVPTGVVRDMGADVVLGVDIRHSSRSMPKNIMENMYRALDIATGTQTVEEADLVICPITEPISGFDLTKAELCLEMGRQAGYKMIAQIEELLARKRETQNN